MKHKLEQMAVEISNTWGPLPIKPVNDAVACLNHALVKVTKADHVRTAIAQLFIKKMREENRTSNGFMSVEDVRAILQHHIDLNTTLYVVTGYWSHHAPSEACDGDETDYCEHQFAPGQLALYDKFGDATDQAFEMTQAIVSTSPNHVTNVRVEVEMNDGDHQYPLGEWTWDKQTGRHFWCQTSGANA